MIPSGFKKKPLFSCLDIHTRWLPETAPAPQHRGLWGQL